MQEREYQKIFNAYMLNMPQACTSEQYDEMNECQQRCLMYIKRFKESVRRAGDTETLKEKTITKKENNKKILKI